jgi:putative ABC transport system permease protein
MRETLHRRLAAWRRWLHADRAERDLHDEIESYAEMLADERRAGGLTPSEARRHARAEAGGVEAVKESVRQARAGAVVEQTLQDVRYALRGLRRTPGFAAAAVVTLALGLGVNAAVFTVVDATLLKPLPYRNVDHLVVLGHLMRAGTPDEMTLMGEPATEVAFWRAATNIFAGVEEYDSRPIDIEDGETGATIHVARFTSGVPDLLGVPPAIGRVFTREEATTAASVAVISDSYWHRRFNADPAALGTTIRLGAEPVTIIGVMPPAFRYGPGTGGATDVWRPLSDVDDGETVFRLQPALTRTTAMPALKAAALRLQEVRHDRSPWTPELRPFDERREVVARSFSKPLWVFLAMSGVVVLVVCANLGNLLRVRFLGRREELAMRTALGASRGRIARLLLVEAGLVIVLGAVAGALLAAGLVKILPSLVPPRLAYSLFVVSLPGVDGRAAAFGALSLACVVLVTFGLLAVRGLRPQPVAEGLNVTGRTGPSREGRRGLLLLQAFQIALALLLVTTGVLVVSSFVHLKTADLGFQADGLYALEVSLPASRYAGDDAQHAWFARTLERVRQLPDVAVAAYGTPPPSKSNAMMSRPEDTTGSSLVGASRRIGEGYFKAVGVPVFDGREFDASDRAGSELVTIVSASAARALWPGESAIGHLMRFAFSARMPPARVVGVVADVAAYDFKAGKPRYAVYIPLGQQQMTSATLILRAQHPGAPVVREAQDVIRSEEPGATMTLVGPVTAYYEIMETYSGPRFFTVLVVVFAVLALVTAAVGLYGLLAYAVGQRRREIGVRVALGATLGQIRALVLTDALRPVGAGLIVGSAASWLLTRYLGSLLYGIGAHDPIAFLASGGVLLLAALVATLAPIRKATGVDPIRALRVE